jgi:hypothetical protein
MGRIKEINKLIKWHILNVKFPKQGETKEEPITN